MADRYGCDDDILPAGAESYPVVFSTVLRTCVMLRLIINTILNRDFCHVFLH